jgi:hypothetical protein
MSASIATPQSRSWCASLTIACSAVSPLCLVDRETRACFGMFDYADLAQLLVLAADGGDQSKHGHLELDHFIEGGCVRTILVR